MKRKWSKKKKEKRKPKKKIKEKYPESPIKKKIIKDKFLAKSEKEEKASSNKEEKIDLKGNKIIFNKDESNIQTIQETKEDILINVEKSIDSRKNKTISKSYFKKINITKEGNCFFRCISYFSKKIKKNGVITEDKYIDLSNLIMTI